MRTNPPLHVIKFWRDEGLSSAEVYRKCEEFVSPKYSAICTLCGKPNWAKGLCRSHYNKQWHAKKVRKS